MGDDDRDGSPDADDPRDGAGKTRDDADSARDDREDAPQGTVGARDDVTRDGASASSARGDDEPDAAALREEVEALREELDAFEEDVEDRTLHVDEVESDLKRYVRRRVRRGKAHGWGPYLVLLYGTAMTLGAFYTPYLSGGWAIFAMIVIWLSTLGLYTLMVVVGVGVSAAGLPGRLRDAISDWRS